MDNINWTYLCTMMGNMAGIPIRIYEDRQKIFFHSVLPFPEDPIAACEQEVLAITSHVGYYVTSQFYYYGVVVFNNHHIVIGPTTQGAISNATLKELAFQSGVKTDDTETFIRSMKALVSFPIESLLEMLCTINYLANREMLALSDVTIQENEQDRIETAVEKEQVDRLDDLHCPEDNDPAPGPVHNTYALEQTLLSFVRNGDVAAFQNWAASAPAMRAGEMSSEQLRQVQDTFIVSAALVSRAAIRGGMDVEDAFSLSDLYISHSELLRLPSQIINLQYRMIMDYTGKVGRIRHGNRDSHLAIEVANYVQHHISEPITTDQIAARLYTSRTRLSANFHKETGETLSHFIMNEKIEEAKRLLRYSDRSLSAISEYLAFSSPSHFSRTFHKYTGMTPAEYRLKHQV